MTWIVGTWEVSMNREKYYYCDYEDKTRRDSSFDILKNMGYKKKEIFFCKAYNIYCAIKEQDECNPEKCDWHKKCKMLSKLNEQER